MSCGRSGSPSDADFLSAPDSMQVARWREFAERYPYAPLPEEYLRALERLEEEGARREQERRIAELEDRVEEAEQRALDAAAQANRAPYYTYYVAPSPVYYREYRPRPPILITGLAMRYSSPHLTVGLNRSQGRYARPPPRRPPTRPAFCYGGPGAAPPPKGHSPPFHRPGR